jgi:UTP--glucose-1-phosphate uridylyltransferase
VIAVIPAAGRGTRMASVTGGTAKEMLPLAGKLLLERVIDEAKASGVPEIVVVASAYKEEVMALSSACGARTVVQLRPEGLAFAVGLAAQRLPCLVLLPDVAFAPVSPSKRLVDPISRGFDIAIAVERVPDDAVGRYGIVEWSTETGRISRVLEKPAPSETPSRWAVASRFAFSARMSDFLQQYLREYEAVEELHLTPVINAAIDKGLTAFAVPLETGETRYDCGTPDGYEEARRSLSNV